MYLETLVDHFNGSDDSNFSLRYILDDTWFSTDNPGPILFYTGNEGEIWNFYNNSGFVTSTLAKEFGALVVFGEHRYYGKSLPYGN